MRFLKYCPAGSDISVTVYSDPDLSNKYEYTVGPESNVQLQMITRTALIDRSAGETVTEDFDGSWDKNVYSMMFNSWSECNYDTLTCTGDAITQVTTLAPIAHPTHVPTQPTFLPSMGPSMEPTPEPSLSPSPEPSTWPTLRPLTEPTFVPTFAPTFPPTARPSREPTFPPTHDPVHLHEPNSNELIFRSFFQSQK